MINNKAYDIIKLIATIIAPIVTFISALLMIWNIPYSEQITQTMTAFTVLINGLVAVLKSRYDRMQRLSEVEK